MLSGGIGILILKNIRYIDLKIYWAKEIEPNNRKILFVLPMIYFYKLQSISTVEKWKIYYLIRRLCSPNAINGIPFIMPSSWFVYPEINSFYCEIIPLFLPICFIQLFFCSISFN